MRKGERERDRGRERKLLPGHDKKIPGSSRNTIYSILIVTPYIGVQTVAYKMKC